MIQVDAETATALRSESPVIKPRITWKHGNWGGTPTDSIDLSDRFVSFPAASSQLGPYLSGAREGKAVLSLLNQDGLFTPNAAGGYFKNRKPAERQMARVDVELGAQKPDGSFGYLPVYSGFVTSMVLRPGVADMDLASVWHFLGGQVVPDDVVIDPSSIFGDTPSDLAKSLLSDNTVLDSTSDFDETWDKLGGISGFYADLYWSLAGRIRAGTPISSAAEAVARSGLGTIVPAEDGTLRFLTEFPDQEIVSADRFGDEIDDSIGWDWSVVESTEIAATSVSVGYQGVSVRYPETQAAEETTVGNLNRFVLCPYIATGRSAWHAAHILYTQHASFPIVKSWSMPVYGSVLQLGDRVPVKDPITDTSDVCRVVAKELGNGSVRLSAVIDGHEASVVNGTFAKWGSTTWNDATELLL